MMDDLRPRFIVLLQPDLATVRLIERYKVNVVVFLLFVVIHLNIRENK